MPNEREEPVGLYLHIPFCVSKCGYCDFPSFAGRLDAARAVVDRMIGEMERAGGLSVDTVYMGGGTPTVLPGELLERLFGSVFRFFRVDAEAEVSVEANPGTADYGKLALLRGCGVNRVSFGAQAMQPQLLRTLGRIHEWKDVERAVADAGRAGIRRVNLDLMYGLPGQKPADWRQTLEAAADLGVGHLSLYSLIVEEGTPFHDRYASHPELLPGEEELAEMADDAQWITADAGLERYEISNYAKPGEECVHNVHCWQRRNYLGIGCAAHSFMHEQRWHNADTLEGYLAGERSEIERITAEEARFERLMLGLRMVDGIPWGEQALYDTYREKLESLRQRGLAEWDSQRLWLTERGLELQNRVLVELMDV